MLAASTPTIGTIGEGGRIYNLNSPNQAGQHEVYGLAFQPKGSLNRAPHGPRAKEQLMVILGVLEIISVENKVLVYSGNTARYDASYLHATHSLDGHAMAFLIVENSWAHSIGKISLRPVGVKT